MAFRGNGEFATRTMIDNTLLFGLERLTGTLPAFVNCTARTLIEQQAGLLPAAMTVLEILETVEPSPPLVAACRHLKSLGFRLALDDFIWSPRLEPLVALVDYVKLDFRACDERERREILARLWGRRVTLIAEKVETQEELQRARAEGFTLFQGYYFCRPILVTRRKVPANRLVHFELLRELQRCPLDLRKTSELVKQDAALTYRLLRLVNSPVCALRQEVRSIQSALVMVGDDVFRRIAMLAIASEFNAGQPAEILCMALVRARFCELASAACALNPLEQYLLGMFSMLPAMLRMRMEEILPVLPLRNDICKALLGEPNPDRALLDWLEANNRGDWLRCDAIALENRIDQQRLLESFTAALAWADQSLSAAFNDTTNQRGL